MKIYLKGIHGQEQDHDFCRNLCCSSVLCNAAAVRDAVKGPNLLELGFCHHEMLKATDHLALMGKMCLVVPSVLQVQTENKCRLVRS